MKRTMSFYDRVVELKDPPPISLDLKRYTRSELLEIILMQSREIDSLREEIKNAQKALSDRRIVLAETGSIAEASLALTAIFQEAEKAVELYKENIKRINDGQMALMGQATEEVTRQAEDILACAAQPLQSSHQAQPIEPLRSAQSIASNRLTSTNLKNAKSAAMASGTAGTPQSANSQAEGTQSTIEQTFGFTEANVSNQSAEAVHDEIAGLIDESSQGKFSQIKASLKDRLVQFKQSQNKSYQATDITNESQSFQLEQTPEFSMPQLVGQVQQTQPYVPAFTYSAANESDAISLETSLGQQAAQQVVQQHERQYLQQSVQRQMLYQSG